MYSTESQLSCYVSCEHMNPLPLQSHLDTQKLSWEEGICPTFDTRLYVFIKKEAPNKYPECGIERRVVA